jgi:hypothetical protein
MVRSVDGTRIDRLLQAGLLGVAAILAVQAGLGLAMGQLIGEALMGTALTTAIATFALLLTGLWAVAPKPDS